MAAVAADGESGRDFYGSIRSVGEDAGGGAVLFLDEAGGLPTEAKGEAGAAGGFGGEEVEEVPLGHECDESGVSGDVREVSHRDTAISDKAGEARDFRVGNGEEFFEETELMEDFEG